MSSGATALAYQTTGRLTPWGGDLRHEQGDLEGGTDLYDLKAAWAEYGETLSIRSGQGWSEVKRCHDEGRAIVAQGEGNVPGSASFDGGHACVIGPETSSSGEWLFGDPLVSSWQWVSVGRVREWMEAWQSSCAFAVSRIVNPPPEPEPAPEPKPPAPPPPPPPGYADGYAAGKRDGRALEADATFASWLEPARGGRWDSARWAEAAGSRWGARPIPLDALERSRTPAEWGAAGWTAATWRD